MSLKKDGYEVLDAQAECDDAYREKRNRLNRVQGYGDYPFDGESRKEGFIDRNNVYDRL